MGELILVEREDADRVVALADLTNDVGADERAARERIRTAVQLSERAEAGTLEVLPHLPEGAIVVLHEDVDPEEHQENADDRHAEMICELVRVAGHTRFTLVIVPTEGGLELVDDVEMAANGWVRASGEGTIGT